MTRLVASPSKIGLRARPWPYGSVCRRRHVGGDDVDRQPVLGVHHDQAAVPRGPLHRPEDRPVVAVEHARVGREQLEVRDALGHEPVHLGQAVVGDVAHDHVEAVVGHRVALGLGVPGIEPLAERLPARLDREVDDVVVPPKAAARVPVSNVSLANVPAERQLHVGVDVDRARDDVAARRIDRLVGAHPAAARSLPMAAIVSPSISTSAAVGALGGDDGAVRDQRAHRDLLRVGSSGSGHPRAAGTLALSAGTISRP